MHCEDCGWSASASRKAGKACSHDPSAFAERLRQGGWGSPGKEAFEEARRRYRLDRERRRAGHQGGGGPGASGGSGPGAREDGPGDDPGSAGQAGGRGGSTNGSHRRASPHETEALSVLGLDAGATASEIKQAWRDLCQIWHPDRLGHNDRLRTKATAKLAEINDAYDVLRSRR